MLPLKRAHGIQKIPEKLLSETKQHEHIVAKDLLSSLDVVRDCLHWNQNRVPDVIQRVVFNFQFLYGKKPLS